MHQRRQQMSRNKDIKLMHDFTGLPYKICRQKMKDNHWNLCQAIGYDEMMKFLSDGLPELCKVMSDAINNMAEFAVEMINELADAIRNIDLGPIDIKPIGDTEE